MGVFMDIFNVGKKYRWYIVSVIVFAALAYYLASNHSSGTPTSSSFSVVDTVDRGTVSSGIQATGKIIAAQKLDLNVYKQLSRINVVNTSNGSHVDTNDILISFDKNDALVNNQAAKVAVSAAELALETAQKNAADPNTQIRTLENQIAGYKKSIADAYQNFLNTDIEAVPTPSQYKKLIAKTAPTISERYVGRSEGQYTIEFYRSQADSGFSMRLSGLENVSPKDVVFGSAINLGTLGLKVTVPSDISDGDTWEVYVPNTDIATYNETKASYDETVAGLKVSLANAEQQLSDLEQSDASSYRNLEVEKAQSSLNDARQKLTQTQNALKELDVIAPFSGTIQDMANVVVGATPVGGTSDSISLGTLVSDTFLTTFTLGATDVAKIQPGQKVNVTITSFRNQPTFSATVTQISSLPSSSGVAQYEVQAALDYDRTKSDIVLREGMLANIEVVQRESTDVLRVPTADIRYENGKPTVHVVDSLTPGQLQSVQSMGVIETTASSTLATHPVTVELGIQGQYFTEIRNGLSEGDHILSTSLSPQTQTTTNVQFRGFGGGGGQRPNGDAGGQSRTQTSNSRLANN